MHLAALARITEDTSHREEVLNIHHIYRGHHIAIGRRLAKLGQHNQHVRHVDFSIPVYITRAILRDDCVAFVTLVAISADALILVIKVDALRTVLAGAGRALIEVVTRATGKRARV